LEKSGRLANHQENGDCYEFVPDIEAGYRVGTEKSSSAVSSVGWLVRHANSASTVVTVSVHCWINMLAIAIFSVGFLGAVFMRRMILYDKGVCVLLMRKRLSIAIAETVPVGLADDLQSPNLAAYLSHPPGPGI
jgi:hypothetical protein